MKRLLVLLVIFILFNLLIGSQVFAQQEMWVARYDGPGGSNGFDGAFAMAVDDSGYIYVTGGSGDTSAMSWGDYATIKYNSVGDTVWVRRYDGPDNTADDAFAIAVNTKGNVYVTGRSVGNGTDYDYATIKYNSKGDTVWVRRYDSGGGAGYNCDEARAITVDDSGNVYVTGRNETIKYDSLGNTMWIRVFDGEAYAITVDNVKNVYVTGISAGGYDYLTIKYDSSGDTVWVRKYSGTGKGNKMIDSYDYTKGFPRGGGGEAIAVDENGYVYVTGNYGGYATTIKYNGSEDTVWVRKYHSSDSASGSEGTALALDNIGNVYITGRVGYDSAKTSDYLTIKYNSLGDTGWIRTYNGPGNGIDCATGIVVDSGGNVYITGYSEGNGTHSDYATIKYSSVGNEEWVQRYDDLSTKDTDYAYAISLDKRGYIYVTGTGSGGTSQNYITIKYSTVGVEEEQTKGNRQQAIVKIIKDKIYLEVAKAMEADIKLYDICGRLKQVIYSGELSKGDYVFMPDVKKSGIYFVKFSVNDFKKTKKMILIR